MRSAFKILFYVGLVGGWQLLASAGALPPDVIPSPYEVGADLAAMAGDDELASSIGISMARLAAGFGAAALGGLGLGVLMAMVRTADQALRSVVLGLQSIPSIAWVPLAIVWFGPTDAGIVFVATAGSIFAVTQITSVGIKNINPHYIEAARNLGARRRKLIVKLLIPASFPYMISGFKQGWAFAWRGVIGAELLFAYLGLGSLLGVGREVNDISQIIAVMVVVMAMGIVVDSIGFKRLETRVMTKWGLR